MPKPTNAKLYAKVKAEIIKKVPKHSAYRSSMIVKEYKKRGGKYEGKKDTSKGLSRWHKEKWKTQEGSTTYKKRGDIFRPTVRVSKKTPTTMSELSKKEIKAAQKEKKATGRVKRYKKKAS
jgi:hypothetical protein